MENQALPVCPTCKQSDQAQKVTSLYASNTKEWKETSTGIDSWGNTVTTEHLKKAHTTLGIKLKLPDEPSGPTHPGLWYGLGIFVLFVFGLILCPIALVPLSFIIPLGTFASAFVAEGSGVSAWLVSALVIGLPSLCILGLGLGLVIWGGTKARRRFDRDMTTYRGKKSVFERDELPRWQRAKSRWEQLFYCMRDETLFIPTENKPVKADDMEKYLYDPTFRSQA